MDENSFREYLNFIIPHYAQDNVESGRWDDFDILERSKKEYDWLLPDGLYTKNNYLFNVIETEGNIEVGYIGIKVEDHATTKSAFLYDVGIYEQHRRNGYAKSALHLIEKMVSELGVTKVALYVFNQNEGAQALYKSIGYGVVSHNMCKVISTQQSSE